MAERKARDILVRFELVRSGRANAHVRLVLIAMAEGNIIHTHQADSPLTIHVVEGDISFRSASGEHRLEEGEVLFFGPGWEILLLPVSALTLKAMARHARVALLLPRFLKHESGDHCGGR